LNVADVLHVGPCGPDSMIVTGGVRSTLHVKEAAVLLTLPARSVARALKTWVPSMSPLYSTRAEQGENWAESRLQEKVQPGSWAVIVNETPGDFVGSVADAAMAAAGGVMSMRQSYFWGVCSESPFSLRVNTLNEWAPSASSLKEAGDVHGEYRFESSLQENDAFTVCELNSKTADVEFVTRYGMEVKRVVGSPGAGVDFEEDPLFFPHPAELPATAKMPKSADARQNEEMFPTLNIHLRIPDARELISRGKETLSPAKSEAGSFRKIHKLLAGVSVTCESKG
jgi:hypothetical protein